ncbi:hypothetical protein [Streptomyces sp. NPDC052012]|uniref:hypothetical protein n=1 Tax=Streptomyces sp. NPDC052012 TaxID=3155051 RepID=UPI00344D7014
MTTRTTTGTSAGGAFRRTNAVIVAAAAAAAAATAGALFAAATGAHAAEAEVKPTTGVQNTMVVDDPEFTVAEQEQGAVLAQGIAELGVTEDQFAAALDVALTRPAPDAQALRTRLAALPARRSATLPSPSSLPARMVGRSQWSPPWAGGTRRSSL